jgi:V/A-type H+-transporting ATPase subunit F
VNLENEINKYKDKPTPAIILIPGREGSLGLAQAALRASVERAVGSDIL